MALPASPQPCSGQRPSPQETYRKDGWTWARQQADALSQRRLEEIDWENLAEEIRSFAED